MDPADLVQQIARINCGHRNRLQDEPCGQCVGGVTRSLRVARPEWVERTARKLVELKGYTCVPTAIDYAEALDLLRTVVPMVLDRA